MIERDLILIGDQAWTPEELRELERRRRDDRERYRSNPKRRAQVIEAVRRFRERYPDDYRTYRRDYQRLRRRHPVGSLHDLACTGPTKATGCRCHKITMYDKP